jgi:hypothetical protein
MTYQIQVLSTKFNLADGLSEEDTEIFNNMTEIAHIENATVMCSCMYQIRDGESFINAIAQIQTFLKSRRNKLTGEIILIQYTTDNITTGKLKLFAQRPLIFEPCKLHITCKSNKSSEEGVEKEPPLSEEDKVELCKRFFAENHREPGDKDMIEGFKVGAFFQKLKYIDEMFHKIEDAVRENL